MPKLILLPFAVLLSAAAPTSPATSAGNHSEAANKESASGSPATASGASATPAEATEKKVCKLLPTTGSRLSKTACLTEKQWKQVEEDMDH
jgi:hypothetical protein